MDYFKQENEITKELFDLDDILEFQLKHDIQIIRDEAYQYCCYINGEMYYIGMTFLGSLVTGVKIYEEYEKNKRIL